MNKWIVVFVVGLALISSADDFSAQRAYVLALGDLTNAPTMQDAEGFPSAKNLKAIYYNTLDWRGNPTKVFAWLGKPENRQGKVPGIVLVHGGGGTAFREWVQKWNERGFAAISIAVEGQTDEKDPDSADRAQAWKRHEWAGPARNGIYGDSNEPLKDQWMYHAVADAVLANSLLRSLPEVDADKVGIMGISWGGVITATAIGIDARFAFAIPTYGCGNLAEVHNQYGRALGHNDLYKQVWDPMVRLNRAKMPVLWFSWPQDQHFPLDKQAACYHAMPGSVMISLVPGMQHGHASAWNRPESYAFAKSVVDDDRPWCRQVECRVAGSEGRVKFAASKPLDAAVLIATVDTGVTGSRKWTETPAVLKREGEFWSASAALPSGTTAWFINVRSGGLTVSSEFQAKAEEE